MKKALFLFGNLNDSDVEWLISNGTRQLVPAGQKLIEIGQQTRSIFIILDGLFSVMIDPSKNKEIARISAGEVMGEMSFVDSRPPSATVTALIDSTVLAIRKEDVNERFEDDPAFGARFYRAIAVFLSDRLRATMITGLGLDKPMNLEEDIEDQDEVSPDLMETIALAGERFVQLQRRAVGANY